MRIKALETVHLAEFSNILFVRVLTDAGLEGLGETYYTPQTTTAFVHEVLAPLMLGRDPRDIEGHWRRLYDATHVYGNRGGEMRAVSALDVALWDIFAQSAGMPLYRALGGASRERVRVYNTCAGSLYARAVPGTVAVGSNVRGEGRYEDYHAFMNHAGDLARELLDEGVTAMKIWPFDAYAAASGGTYISYADIDEGLEPFKKIRDAVGTDIEIMVEGHGHWKLPAAVRLAEALEPYKPMWLEDLMKPDNAETLAQLRRSTSIPVCGSELALTRYHARDLLRAQAVDIVMTDVTWTGGLSESRKIAAMADAENLPFAAHDCTGPVTLMASIHLSLHCPNALIQESVRAYYRGFYAELTDRLPRIEGGYAYAPQDPGLGMALKPEVFERPDATVRRSAE